MKDKIRASMHVCLDAALDDALAMQGQNRNTFAANDSNAPVVGRYVVNNTFNVNISVREDRNIKDEQGKRTGKNRVNVQARTSYRVVSVARAEFDH